jgi:hypothetical protein
MRVLLILIGLELNSISRKDLSGGCRYADKTDAEVHLTGLSFLAFMVTKN